MIDAFVRSFLGEWGGALLDFYLANSLWINALLLLYAGVVVFARRNYWQTLAAILSNLQERYGESLQKKTRAELKSLLQMGELPWDKLLEGQWFPFIAVPKGFLIRIRNRETLQQLFNADILSEVFHAQNKS